MAFDLNAFRRECLSDPLVQNVWDNKYRWKRPDGYQEQSIAQSQERVVQAICGHDSKGVQAEARLMISNGYFLPAGRINAGAGTERNVTLLNCYVGDTINDSMPGIQYAIAKAAFTLQQGGGIGNDFSTIRPADALVKRTGSVASGAIAFMHQMSTMSDTVCSAGERRGAMMTTLADWHPDLWNEDQFETMDTYTGEQVLRRPSFISVKRQKGKLTQTNISVLISDAFMKAVDDDTNWDLGFWTPRADGKHIEVYNKPFPYDYAEMDNDFKQSWLSEDVQGRSKGKLLPWYVYRRVPARRIWEDLMQSTYKYAEPGVIFIDRINDRNNLKYCETIRCTNPCGEQPLPPHGTCCLGSVNVAFMVDHPFTPEAKFNINIFKRAVYLGVRFLDNVLDIAKYPLAEQHRESMAKRRIGLGLTGVADLLLQLGQTYGSNAAVMTMQSLGLMLKEESYATSALLASERGSFPDYDADEFAKSWNLHGMSQLTLDLIKQHGMRNGVLNTEAPNGTISIYSGNTAQGIEPVFSFDPIQRKVRQPDGSLVDYASMNYSHRLYNALYSDIVELPDYFVSALIGRRQSTDNRQRRTITPEAHIRMQAACQEFIDASISKTVNCPPEMTFDEFAGVYIMAYEEGCKGCTTYRPDPDSGRGSVLSVAEVLEPAVLTVDPNADIPKLMEAFYTITKDGMKVVALQYLDNEEDPKGYRTAVDEAAKAVGIGGLTPDTDYDFAVGAESLVGEHGMAVEVKPQQRVVEGRRYRLKWPVTGENWFVTITRHEGEPFEVFITTKRADHAEWVQAISLLLTAILRRGGDVRFLINELAEVHSAAGGAHIADQHKYRPSVVAAIAGILEEEFKELGLYGEASAYRKEPVTTVERVGDLDVLVTRSTNPDPIARAHFGKHCPECGSDLVHEQGCQRCATCGWSNCG